jgi:hypothetical protein
MSVPISNVTRRQVYAPSGAGGAGPYAFTFEILANTDIAVYKDDVLLTLTTHYTVTINANGTGSVTITAAGLALTPTSPTQYAIVGNRTISRTTDFTTGGDFFANTLNDELDQQTIFAQQNAEGLQRALSAPQTDPTSINMTLPRAALRANKALGFDANGNPAISDTVGTNRGNWSAGVLYYARDIVKDTTNNNIWQCLVQHTSSGSQPINTNADSAKWSLLVDAASASTSASNAASSASAASASASNASTSASNASTSASNASTSASNAASSASAASTSASNAAASYDSFDDRYLGSKSSAPSVDNDGNSLLTGALYWDTVINQMRVWSGTAWVNVNASASNTRTAITATAGQTVLTVATYTPGTNTMVMYVNGVKLNASEYAETNSTTITVTTGLALNDEVEVFSYRVNEIGTLGASSVTIADTGNYYAGGNVEDALQEAAQASTTRFIQAGTGAVTRTVQAKNRDVVNIKDYGASSGASQATNKTALQTAITAVDAAGGGQIVVDYDINYGVKTRTPSTWPDFTGVTKPIIVLDYSRGDTQAPNVYPTAYDGAMYRVWTFTPQTTSPGQHDGNTQWLRAAWAPAYCISNDMNLAAVGHPSRTSMDNRRAYYATMVDGEANWQWGNGTLAGASLTDEELSNFVIEKFAMTGDTLGGYTPYLVERKTGNVSYSGGRNIPNAHHHFESVTGSPARNIAMFESKATTTAVTFRNSNGSGDDIEFKNVAGSLRLNIPAQGDALVVAKTTRYIGVGDDAPSYRFDLVENRASNFVERIRNTSTTNGSITRWESSSASSGGWTFLDAFSGGTADREFQLSGNGSGYCDGAWNGGGADYAEYFEWADGNPDNEDRRGFSVSLVNGKIQKAQPGDVVIGVISGNPSVVGDAAWNKWKGKYLRDDFGGYVMEPCQIVEWDERIKISDEVEAIPPSTIIRSIVKDDGSVVEVPMHDPGRAFQPERWETKRHSYMADAIPDGMTVPEDAEWTEGERRKLNPTYDSDADYIPRAERPEWGCVGLMGKLRVRKGQPTDARWVKMREISAAVEEWLVR